MNQATASAEAQGRISWPVILLVPRLAFYGFMAFRWIQLTQTNVIHGNDKRELEIFFGVAILVMAVVIEAGVWGIAAAVRAGKRQKERYATQLTEYNAHIEQEATAIMNEPLQPIPADGLILQSGESCYLREPARLYSTQTLTQRVGGYGGVSMRVPGTHGLLRVNTGRFASTPVSRTQTFYWNVDLIVTNKRIISLNPRGNSTWALDNIVAIKPFTDGVQVDFSHGQPLIVTTGNQRLGIILQRVLHEVTLGQKQA